MRDMFYNYDHNIKTPDPQLPDWITPSTLVNSTEVKKLLNAGGDEIGVSAKQNSKFCLYFNFTDCLSTELYKAVCKNLYFDVLDFKYEIISSCEATWDEYSETACVEVDSSETGPLKYGVYRMHLYTKIDDKIYTLFSPQDGVLSIE